MLGVESGASVTDFTGEIQKQVQNALHKDLNLTFRQLKEQFFHDQDGLIKMNQISPRCFEAAALRTVMVLYEGDYSNKLVPWRHYIPLKKDHSNMNEVIQILRDGNLCDTIAKNTYEEVALDPSNSYKQFIKFVDESIDSCFREEMRSQMKVYSKNILRIHSFPEYDTVFLRCRRFILLFIHLFLFRVVLRFFNPAKRDLIQIRLRKVYRQVRYNKWGTQHRSI